MKIRAFPNVLNVYLCSECGEAIIRSQLEKLIFETTLEKQSATPQRYLESVLFLEGTLLDETAPGEAAHTKGKTQDSQTSTRKRVGPRRGTVCFPLLGSTSSPRSVANPPKWTLTALLYNPRLQPYHRPNFDDPVNSYGFVYPIKVKMLGRGISRQTWDVVKVSGFKGAEGLEYFFGRI